MEAIQFTTPPGRLVAGNLYKPNDKDHQGNPLLAKSGPNMGKPRVDYFFAVAIPKVPGQHWATSEWGSKIWQAGHQFMANAGQMPAFAWKITDGDSDVPNSKGRKPRDQEGYPGHWVLRFGGGFAPKIARALSGAPEWDNTLDLIKPGDYVQVMCSVEGNGAVGLQAGVYLNHHAVCLVGYGKRINTGVDLAQAGFGGQPLPSGASTTPVAVGFGQPQVPGAPTVAAPPHASSPAAPAGVPAVPAVPPMTAPAGTTTSPSSPLPPIPGTVPPPGVVPNMAFLQVPGAPGAVPTVPAVPMAPPAAPVRQMTAKASGFTYEQLVSQGWTDALLVQHGMMTA